jgi:DNA invertase Pin-like site-specific DNA recombinase
MVKKKIAYIRPLTEKQSLNRQISNFVELGINREDVFCDEKYGEFYEYQMMKKKINQGDVLYIKSLQVLGENTEEIVEELSYIKNIAKANVNVLDMFMMDTTKFSRNIQSEEILSHE